VENTLQIRKIQMKNFIKTFLNDEAGQDLVEYALLLSLLAIAGVAGLGTLANAVNNIWTNAGTKVS
jgi:pilus assembly protein Flp/PilA